MSTKHDQLIKAAADLVHAGRRLKAARDELRMASVGYGLAQAHYDAITKDSPVRPVITSDLPVLDSAEAVRQMLEP